jgi:hypothetical protein
VRRKIGAIGGKRKSYVTKTKIGNDPVLKRAWNQLQAMLTKPSFLYHFSQEKQLFISRIMFTAHLDLKFHHLVTLYKICSKVLNINSCLACISSKFRDKYLVSLLILHSILLKGRWRAFVDLDARDKP